MAEIPSACWTDIVPHIKFISVAAEMVVPEPSPPVPLSKNCSFFVIHRSLQIRVVFRHTFTRENGDWKDH